ncbi:MAG: glycosyltransferase family 4 protein [Nitriliruptoraceae bacterium]
MNIVMVSPYDLDRPGGVQNHVRELARTLTTRGHTVLTLAPGATGMLGKSTTVRINGSRAPIGLSTRGVRELRRYIDTFQPDVVHIHEPGVPRIGWAAARHQTSAVIVATCHAYSEPARYAPLLAPIGRRIIARIDRLIAVSGAAKQFHSRACGIATKRFTVIGNGIDLTGFTPATPRADQAVSEAPRLVYVGRFDQRKGVDVLLKAFLQLKHTHPQAELTLVGDGPERTRLKQFVAANQLDGVTFTGRVSDSERAHWLTWADIAIAPARGGESFGIVLLEALASGCALIASDIAGYRDVAMDGRDAWLVPPDNVKQLTATLQRVVADPKTRQKRRTSGLARAEQFAWPNVTTAIEAVYRDALTNRR